MDDPLAQLNPAQRAAVVHGVGPGVIPGPLLVLAGAGSGKTHTLAHRVAHLILNGAHPKRILLLTFTRRAAREMSRRVEHLVLRVRRDAAAEVSWAGTFHGIANRVLRLYAEPIGLDPGFTILDQSDAEDLLDLVRTEQGLSERDKRFPRKGTCLAIYSRIVNAQLPLERCLADAFTWCVGWAAELQELFRGYVREKQRRHVLDYDDLLLYWFHLMSEPSLAAEVRQRFDHVLVDEYQDTNHLQSAILLGLAPDGRGVTVVGDDAQAIYSFRGATVKNILEFPASFDPNATIVALEQNYRSTQPILDVANALMGESQQSFPKALFSGRSSDQKPVLVTAEDELEEVRFVAERVLQHREQGVLLKHQAVLFRTAHHSDALEVELGRRSIPYVKYGGLKFLEAAHVKDVLCVLRWAENPRDAIAAARTVQLLPGVGPVIARRVASALEAEPTSLEPLRRFRPPAAAASDWPLLCELLSQLRGVTPWEAQLGLVRAWYAPHLERLYDVAPVRAADLEQLEQVAGSYPSRERFLAELALDPPDKSGDEAGVPLLDEDFLILSTIHSAKGQEWEVVYVIHAADGCIPSDMSTGNADQVEEERRLMYVAMTRAKRSLYVVHPQRFFVRQQHRHGDRHVYTPVSRFLSEAVRAGFQRTAAVPRVRTDAAGEPIAPVDLGERIRRMWD